jgi:ribosome-binding protein aMBF1 (putative translation factor)
MPDIGDNSDVQMGYDELQGILDELAGKQKAITEATGSLRSRLAQVLEEHNLNKSALATVRKIENMSLTARNDFLRTFEPLFDVMIEKKWRDEQQDLFDDPTEREE